MNLTETEIKNILDLHIQEKTKKSFFVEQAGSLRSQLDYFIKSGCISGGTIGTVDSKNPNKQLAIIKPSTKDPNKDIYFFIDFTYGSYDDAGKFVFGGGKWNCDKFENSKLQTTLDDAKKTTANIQAKKEEFINKLTRQNNKKYKIDPTELEKLTLKPEKIDYAPKELFPNGLTLWYDPQTQSTIKGKEESVLSDILNNQSVDRDVCRKNIEDYFTSFKRKNSFVVDPVTINRAKAIVQACKDEHYGKWGVLGSGKKIDEYLDILSGNLSGGPTSYGEDSKWRLK